MEIWIILGLGWLLLMGNSKAAEAPDSVLEAKHKASEEAKRKMRELADGR